MAKLRVMSGKEACAILERREFVRVRQRGSHIIMQRTTDAGATTVPVPDHKEILIGTLPAPLQFGDTLRSILLAA